MTEQMEKSTSVPYTKNYLAPTDVCGKCLYIKSQCKCRKRETTMTENEAREYLLNRYLVVGSPVNPPKEECEKHNAVIDMAIQALEKQSMINEILEEMWQLNEISKGYCEVGTLEEFKQYREIGTVEELQDLKEKSVAKKPIEKEFAHNWHGDKLYITNFFCPNCNNRVERSYCPTCGQLLDWE